MTEPAAKLQRIATDGAITLADHVDDPQECTALSVNGIGHLSTLSSARVTGSLSMTWRGVVSNVDVCYVHVTRPSDLIGSRWQVTGWLSRKTPTALFIRAGPRAVVGLLNDMAPVQSSGTFYKQLPGGGGKVLMSRRKERLTALAAFEFVEFTFHIDEACYTKWETSRSNRVPCILPIKDAIRWLANQDMLTKLPTHLTCGVISGAYDILWSDYAWSRFCLPVLKLYEDGNGQLVPIQRRKKQFQSNAALWQQLIGEEIAMESVNRDLDRTQLLEVMDLIYYYNTAARSILSVTLMNGVFASLVLHLARFPQSITVIRDFVYRLLSVLCVSHRRLLYKIEKAVTTVAGRRCRGPWRASLCSGIGDIIKDRIKLAFKDTGNPERLAELRSRWPFTPDSMVVLYVPFEEAHDLGLSLCGEETFLLKGTVYFGPKAVELARRGPMGHLRDRLCYELKVAADYTAEDEAVTDHLLTMAVPLTFGRRRKKMSAADIDDAFDQISVPDFHNEERKRLAKIISYELSIDERARRMEFLEELLVKEPQRLKELKGWIKWYDEKSK